MIWLYVAACPLTAGLILGWLESYSRPVTAASLPKTTRWIIVLSGGCYELPGKSPADQLTLSTLKRTLEAVRLAKSLPRAKVVFCGGNMCFQGTEAAWMARVAGLYGLDKTRMVIEDKSRDTIEQARAVAKLIGRAPCLLVTSAGHMARAAGMFRKARVKLRPAPTDFQRQPSPFRIMDLLPSPGALVQTRTALHECLGLLWAWMRGQL